MVHEGTSCYCMDSVGDEINAWELRITGLAYDRVKIDSDVENPGCILEEVDTGVEIIHMNPGTNERFLSVAFPRPLRARGGVRVSKLDGEFSHLHIYVQ